MIKVHVLTDRFETQNSRAFLTPLLVNAGLLRGLGLDFRYFFRVDSSIVDCDLLMVNAKYYGPRWTHEEDQILEEISNFSTNVGAVYYCDTYDSSGLIRSQVLPHVTLYLKSQLLSDRSLYCRPLYGGRLFADYYHREAGIKDSRPYHSDPITDPTLLDKLRVSWNMGLSSYGPFSSRLAALYRYLPSPWLLDAPTRFHSPSTNRTLDVSCRIGINYNRETVAYQRQAIRDILQPRIPTNRVSRRQFFAELSRSKIVVSPFGWGEFALRDYETFLSGALLLKPDMSHMETYPDIYRDGKTMVAHRWDLTDFEDKLNEVLEDYPQYVAVSEGGQELYRHHLTTRDGRQGFALRVKDIVTSGLNFTATTSPTG
jgi:hypothetical protein